MFLSKAQGALVSRALRTGVDFWSIRDPSVCSEFLEQTKQLAHENFLDDQRRDALGLLFRMLTDELAEAGHSRADEVLEAANLLLGRPMPEKYY